MKEALICQDFFMKCSQVLIRQYRGIKWSEKNNKRHLFTEGAKSAITVISGVNPDNQIYYKIVVKTDGADDRIESLPMDYTLKEDTSKPPVPREVTIVDRKLVSRINEESGEVEYSTDVTISWAKPPQLG